MNTTPSKPISLYWRTLRHLLAEQRYPCGHRSKPRRHRDTSSAAIDAGGLCLPGAPGRHHDRRGCHRRRFRVGVFLRADRAALPASWNVPERMAAAALRLGRWGPGARLMQAADPEKWRELAAASPLWNDNGATLEGCARSAARTGKAQRCTVTLAPPTAPNPGRAKD